MEYDRARAGVGGQVPNKYPSGVEEEGCCNIKKKQEVLTRRPSPGSGCG